MRKIVILAALFAVSAHADPSFETLERGRVLATAGDCIACHTAPGGAPFAGGRPLPTPFGVLVTPNITPDRDTGIGAWTDEDFIRAVSRGIDRDGAHLYPAFPYVYYSRVTREDALAVRAFLNTLDPVRNVVESNQLPFPFDVRATMIGWNGLFFEPGVFKPNAAKSAEWNRGAYLVEGLGHCGACHTAKNVLGADRTSRPLQGAVLQDWFAPNLTADLRTGLGGWSVDEIVEYLATGRNARSAASGPMAEVVAYSTSQLPTADVRAMAVYLKDQPARTASGVAPMAADAPAMVAGAAIFQDSCTACHRQSGEGVPRLFPSLKGSAVVQSDDPTTVVRVVLNGALAVATDAAPTAPAMPPFGWKLSDPQVAAVATYVRNAWGNAASPVSAAQVHELRAQLAATSN